MPERIYMNIGQLVTTAEDEATAEQQITDAYDAIKTALAALPAPVTFEGETEAGRPVLSQA